MSGDGQEREHGLEFEHEPEIDVETVEAHPLSAEIRAALRAMVDEQADARFADDSFLIGAMEKVQAAVATEAKMEAIGRPSDALVAGLRRELSAIEPAFSGRFVAEWERRVLSRANRPQRLPHGRPPTPIQRMNPRPLMLALAVALFLLVLRPMLMDDAIVEPGEVRVSAVSFEGTVTVTTDPGVALIWLADVGGE